MPVHAAQQCSKVPGGLSVAGLPGNDVDGPARPAESLHSLATSTMWAHVDRQPSSNMWQHASDASQPPLQLLIIGAYGYWRMQPSHHPVRKVTCMPGHMHARTKMTRDRRAGPAPKMPCLPDAANSLPQHACTIACSLPAATSSSHAANHTRQWAAGAHLLRASGCSRACTQSSATSARGMLRGDSFSSSSSTPSTSSRSPPC